MTKKKKEKKITDVEENISVENPTTKKDEETTDTPTSENNEPEISELDKLTADLADSKDKYLRLYSEFDNFRRRTAKEKLDLVQTAGEKILYELLPVLDDFDRAGKLTDSKDTTSLLEGIELISQKFKKILENQGLKEMETPVGTDFNPDLHEAITQIEAPKKKLKGKIIDTIEKGYCLGEKVIRFTKVVTGS